MKILNFLIIFFFLAFTFSNVNSGNWCKVIYNEEISPGDLQKQISKCKNSDNFFLAIHNSYSNAGNLLNSFIAELCDLRRTVIKSEPKAGNPYFSSVCEFRKNFLRE
jgi:hypothetical protein|tara:strand:+ start:219 stop:539 length:321 start_codon:yes stop_codon:yes gene_type:complete